MLPPPPPSKPAKVPQTSTLFKHHCFCLRLSKESKESFDKESWTNKVLANGGQVALPPVFSPKTSTFLVTDVDYAQLQSVYGTSTLVKLNIVSLKYVDQQLALRQQVLESREKKISSPRLTLPSDAPPPPPPPANLPRQAAFPSSSSTQKRPRSPSPSHPIREDHPPPSALPPIASGSNPTAAMPPPSSVFMPFYPRTNEEEVAYIDSILPPHILAFADKVSAKRKRLGLDDVQPHRSISSSSSSSRPTPFDIASALNLASSSSSSLSTIPRIILPPHPSLKGERAAYFNPQLPSPYFRAGVVLEEPSARRDARGVVEDPVGQWGFPRAMVEKFPALRKRNFFVIQWHQATALHFDLRLQCAYSSTNESDDNFIRLPKNQPPNPGTISFAIPKGVHGMPLTGHDNGRYAAQTNLHPISYTTYEGADGRRLSSEVMCGTLLWDIGTYTVVSKNDDPDSDDESDDEDDSDHQERLLIEGMMKRSFEITLHGHHKVKSLTLQFSRTGVKADSRGRLKPEWIFKRTDRGGKAVEVDAGGSDYATGGRSCLTGKTLREVCESKVEKWAPWLEELGMGLEEE